MTPREFIKRFRNHSSPTPSGGYNREPLTLGHGEKVGVLLMSLGGAEQTEEVEAALYQRLVSQDSLLPEVVRRRRTRFVAGSRAKRIRKGYDQIGGMCPQSRRTREQAKALEARLNARFGTATGVLFCTYTASLSAEGGLRLALANMRRDEIDKVVLLPLYPQHARSTTGVLVRTWQAAEEIEGLPARLPSTLVYTYAEHPKYVQAISERIDEALQRFPRHMRGEVPFVFSAPATPLRDLTRHRDAFHEQFHATVRNVMAQCEAGDAGRAFHVSFRQGEGLGKTPSLKLEDTLEQLVDDGHAAVLVIPAAEVSDRVETVYGLDIALREKARVLGLEHFEVTRGLNGHPLFIDALAECVAGQLRAPERARVDDATAQPHAEQDETIGIEMLVASEQAQDISRSKAA